MSRFGDGLAAGGDLLAMAEQATASALATLGGRVPDLLCVFATGAPDDVQEALLRAVQVSAASASIGALLFSCNGRGEHLFGSAYGGADHDPALVRRELAALGVAGFFAGGELGPVVGRNHLHGFTASVLAFPC